MARLADLIFENNDEPKFFCPYCGSPLEYAGMGVCDQKGNRIGEIFLCDCPETSLGQFLHYYAKEGEGGLVFKEGLGDEEI